MSTRPCARCGTPIPSDAYLCVRCRDELPIDQPARVAIAAPAEPENGDGRPAPGPVRRTWRGQPVPKGMVLPSRTQYHGTMYALIAIGVAITMTLAVLVNKGVGPFVVASVQASTNVASGEVQARATVRNSGAHAGKARCVALWTNANGGPQQTNVVVTGLILPGRTGDVTIGLPSLTSAPQDLRVDCK